MILKIPNATPDEKDAAQYMIRHGRKHYNLCGEFCIAYLAQDEAHTDNIEDFLDYWQAKNLTRYQSLFKNGLARTTSIYDLDGLLSDYGYSIPSLRFGNVPMTPLSIQEMLKHYQAVVGVHIDYSGYLVGKGIPHWIVLESIAIIDNLHAIVQTYNPFNNAMEPYSWRELMTSTGAYKNGIWVRREIDSTSGVLREKKNEPQNERGV